MLWWWKRKKERERAEAERALSETRIQAAKIQAREDRDKGLFAGIHRIRRENHIADAVGKLMEGRN